MKREVIQDFLNLPGIAGVALMDRRSRPYFCGVDQALNFQQKEALVQGIQQVVETTPPGFDFFEFQFARHQVYIYKLDHGIILLVLVGTNLIPQGYDRVIQEVKADLQQDVANAIATFRLLAGNITLSNLNYWKQPLPSPVAAGEGLLIPSGSMTNTSAIFPNGAQSQASTSTSPTTAPLVSHRGQPTTQPIADPQIDLKELLATLNHLSQFTTQYLGTTVITNYWKSTCPDQEWLSNFEIDRSAHFTFPDVKILDSPKFISTEQHQWVREWVDIFIKRCSKVIRDFPSIIEQRALDERQKILLLRS